ncbi:glycosyltransferase family 22 protein [Wolfiporia cocos MD-104 SS10]|uniref:Mannosyltransferase n=1 Tax=Wolfiporia cocos (strain MD-104) TaxID=742152 RepID=A0A2H3J8C1_WOLCO|nr:glycosyltransferase family 22 protein [Wolfiporia cocos MD-104 SS10]
MRRSTIPVLALLVRICVALTTRTFFQPDEYFQSLEVAHNLVFGYGQLTWEWMSAKPIRSILYPALNVPVYWVLKQLCLDDTELLIWGPKILHGAFAAGTDIWLCELTRKVLGERYVSAALFLSLTSFFHALSLSRSISNSLETTLTTIALSHYPWDPAMAFNRAAVQRMLIFAALSCAVRPTNAVIWVYVIAMLLWRHRQQWQNLRSVVLDASVVGLMTLSAVLVLDSAYYGTMALTPLNFLVTNLSAVSLFYGSSPWHYYLTQAIPILCTTALPFVLHGAWQAARSRDASRAILGLIAWTVGVYSLAGHKEWRFLHPLLPLMHVLASKSLVDASGGSGGWCGVRIRRAKQAVVLLALPVTMYVVLVHSRAPVDVAHFIRHLPYRDVQSIGMLMPCHSTPWQAYLHRADLAGPGRLWALGCEPPLSRQDVRLYQDQTDVFFNSPAAYLRAYFPSTVDPAFPPSPYPSTPPGAMADRPWRHEWPQYIVCFGALLENGEVRAIMEMNRYREVWKSESGWEGDPRRRGGVRVWQFQPVRDRR